jgi:N-acetylneuraminic acid mutarotase
MLQFSPSSQREEREGGTSDDVLDNLLELLSTSRRPGEGALARPYGDAPSRIIHRNVSLHWTDACRPVAGDAASKSIPGARFGHTAVVHNDEMLVFGGRDSHFLNDLWSFSFETGMWKALVDGSSEGINCPSPRAGHTAVVNRNSMWVFGGNMGHNPSDCKNEVWRYAIDRAEWDPIIVPAPGSTRPVARKGHTAVRRATPEGEGMLIFGGQGVHSDSKVWQFTFDTQKWSVVKTTGVVPAERLYHVAEMIDGDRMLVFGGRSAASDGVFFDDLHELTLSSSNVWRKLDCFNGPSARMCASSVYRNGSFCVFFGGSTEYFGDCFEFDTASGSWRQLLCDADHVISPCTRPTTVVWDNRLTLFGGCTASSYLNATVQMALEAPTLRELARQWLRRFRTYNTGDHERPEDASDRGISPWIRQYLASTH